MLQARRMSTRLHLTNGRVCFSNGSRKFERPAIASPIRIAKANRRSNRLVKRSVANLAIILQSRNVRKQFRARSRRGRSAMLIVIRARSPRSRLCTERRRQRRVCKHDSTSRTVGNSGKATGSSAWHSCHKTSFTDEVRVARYPRESVAGRYVPQFRYRPDVNPDRTFVRSAAPVRPLAAGRESVCEPVVFLQQLPQSVMR